MTRATGKVRVSAATKPPSAVIRDGSHGLPTTQAKPRFAVRRPARRLVAVHPILRRTLQLIMESTSTAPPAETAPATPTDAADARISELGSLLAAVEDTSHQPERQTIRADDGYENHLAQVRLGIATSLFLALKAKHGPSAAHSLRVAISCSSWATMLGLDDSQRDEV